VVAIEADPWLASLLNRSARIPATRAPIAVICAAAADQPGLLEFAITSGTRAGSHLTAVPGAGDELVGPVVEIQTVVAITLDWLLARRPAPQVVKLDVEGAELMVLRGAHELLRRHRPKLLLEVHAHAAAEISALLRAAGYDLFQFGHGWAGRHPVELATYHTLALPRAT
jgi:FkbM family methyltransferase